MREIETLHLKLDADDMQKIQTELMADYEKISPEMHLSAIAEKLGKKDKMLALVEVETISSVKYRDIYFTAKTGAEIHHNDTCIIYYGVPKTC